MTRPPVRPPAAAARPAAARPALARVALAALLSAAIAFSLVGGLASAQEKNAPAQKAPAGKAKGAAGATKKKATKPAAGKGKGKGKAKPAATQPSGPDDALVVPYIGDNTFVVARLDVAKLDIEPLAPFFTALTDTAARRLQAMLGPDAKVTNDPSASVKQFGERLKRLGTAGGRYAYVLVDGDLWSPEAVVVVPVRKGADVKAMTEVLKEVAAGTDDTVTEVGKALIMTSRAKVVSINARVTAAAAGGGTRGKASERPHLTAAFAAAGDAPIRVAVVPGESFRIIVGQWMRTLPDTWGGGDPVLLARGMRWMTLAVHQKPAFTFNLTVQAANPEAAEQIFQKATQGVAHLKAEAAPDEETKALRAKQVESAKLAKQGDTTVTLTLPGEFFGRGVPDSIVAAAYTRFTLKDDEGDGQSTPPPPPAPAPPAAAAAPLPADDKLIVPYLSAETYLVGRFDVARVDVAALDQFINEAFVVAPKVLMGRPDVPKPSDQEFAQAKVAAAEGLKLMREGLSKMAAAGGHHIYILGEGDPSSPIALVTPVRAGADSKQLTELLRTISGPNQQTTTVGQALVTSTPAGIEVLKKRLAAGTSGTERPELAKALAVAGEAPLRLAFVPGESTRQLVETSISPRVAELGGDPALIARGIRTLTLAVQQKPAMSVTLSAAMADEASAAKLVGMANAFIEEIKSMPIADAAEAAKGTQYLASLAPRQQGDTVTIAIEGELMQIVVPAGIIGGLRAKAMAAGRAPVPPTAPPAPEGDGFD